MGKQPSTLWGIHAGKTGDADQLFLRRNVVALGWKAVGDLSKLPADREAFEARVKERYPDEPEGYVRNAAGQLFRFAHEAKAGDYVLPALKAGIIEMTDPTKPRSSKQRCRLTPLGQKLRS